jgi:hypothetical protein
MVVDFAAPHFQFSSSSTRPRPQKIIALRRIHETGTGSSDVVLGKAKNIHNALKLRGVFRKQNMVQSRGRKLSVMGTWAGD